MRYHKALVLVFLLTFLPAILGCNQGTPHQEQNNQPPIAESNQAPAERNAHVDVNGIDLTGLSREDALGKLTDLEYNMLNKTVGFSYKEQEFDTTLRDLGIITNKQELLDKIYQGNKEKQDLSLQLAARFPEDTVKQKLKTLLTPINRPAKDAKFSVNKDNTMAIIPHQMGVQVDIDKTLQALKQTLATEKNTISVPVHESKPQVLDKDLQAVKFDGPIASFSTTFTTEDKNRTENMQKAVQTLDMTLLKPGEVFSFNKVVGPRTPETGYKEAPIIEENELVPGVGGGICQVSSTLYNVALLADLPIEERHHHEFAVRYVPPGRDATVVYPKSDLKFKNDTQGLLLLRTEIKDTALNMVIYGRNSNKKVELRTEIESTKPFATEKRFDSTLPPGAVDSSRQGMKGYVVRTFRIVKVNDQVVKNEDLGKNIYKPAKRIIRIGPPKGKG